MNLQEMFTRLTGEIRNKMIAELFPAFQDIMSQGEFARRTKIDPAQLSRQLTKLKAVK